MIDFQLDFFKVLAPGSPKNWFLIFGLVHIDAKLHEDSESDLIFPNFWRKSGRKWRFVARLGDMSMRLKIWKLVII